MKTDSSNQHTFNPAVTNTRDFISRLIKKWPWFLICGILGLAAGLIISQYSPDKYEVSTTLLLRSDSESGAINSVFSEQNTQPKSTVKPTDQAGIVQSYRLNLKALHNLNWRVSWYEKKAFSKKDLYLYEPFTVTEHGPQTQMIPINIKPVSADLYEINVDGKVSTNGIMQEINFTKQVRYGEVFKNQYFNFTLKKKEDVDVIEGRDYILIFNDLSQLARAYKERLEVSLGEDNSNLIYVKMESTQPLRDINFLNELGSVYIEFGMEEKNKIADNTLRFINHQLVGVTDSLQEASKDFTTFRSKNRIVDLGQEASMVVETLEQIEREEAASRMRLDYYNNLRRYLNNGEKMKDLVAPSVVGITDASLNALVLKLSELYSQRELLSYSVQEKNPDLVSLDNTIQYTQKILTENINNLLNNTNLELKNLGDRKGRVNSVLSRLPKTEQDLINIKRSFDLNNELYTFLLKKRAEVGIVRASNNPDATILDTARLDAIEHLGPNKYANMLIGLVLGLGLPLMVMLVIDYFDNKLKSAEEVEAHSALAIAGRIYGNKLNTGLPVVQYPNASVTESFRTLRTNLYYLLNDPAKKIIAIHSPIVGEGKSFVSINLAAILAANNKRVLLVETDMRRPRLYITLKLNKEKGLSNYLSERVPMDQIVQPAKIKGLSFVASGSTNQNHAELLNTPPFEKFLSEARADFDFIVLDSVPTDILSDAAIVGRHADINLMVLRMNYSTEDQLKSVNKIAHEGTMENMALVLNDVSDANARKQLKKYGYL